MKVDFIKKTSVPSIKPQEEYNVPLLVLEVDHFDRVPEELSKFAMENDVSVVWFNNEPEWDESRDGQRLLKRLLADSNILCRRFEEQCIVNPGLVLTKESKPYSVFTPFKNTWLAHIEASPVVLESDPVRQTANVNIKASDIDAVFPNFQRSFNSKMKN